MLALAALVAIQGGADIVNWSGFRYLHGQPGTLTTRSQPILEPVAPVKSEGSTRALKVHVAISTKRFGYRMAKDDGFNPIAMYFNDGDVEQIKTALSDAVNDIDAETVPGSVRVRLSTSIETDPIVATSARLPQLPRSWPDTFVSTFANAGKFVADDHVDRGPFDVIIWVHPGPPIDPGDRTAEIGIGAMPSRGRLAYRFNGAIRRCALGELFGKSAPTDNCRPLAKYLRGGSVTELVDRHTRTAAERRVQLARSQSPIYESGPVSAPNVSVETRTIQNATIGVSTSTDGESYLRITESRLARESWIGLPRIAADNSAKSLTIRLRSTTPERLDLVVRSPKGSSVVTDLSLATGPDGPFRFDGAWHTLTCPLPTERELPLDIALGAPDRMSHTGAPVEYDISLVDLSPVEPTKAANLEAADPALPEVQIAAMDKFLRSDKLDAARAALTSQSDFLKASILQLYTRYKDPAAIDIIAEQAYSINPAVAATALTALASQESDEAIAALRKHARASSTEIARGIALFLVSRAKDQLIEPLAEPFILVRSPSARYLATLALYNSKSVGVRRLLVAFLLSPDQEVKRSVTLAMTDPNPEEIKKLTWSAINEPFDDVRAFSYLQLANSKDPAARAEGLKVAFDESWAVRATFYSASDDLKVIQLGLKDRDWGVRRAVLVMLSIRAERVSWADVSELVHEDDPDVLAALANLAVEKQVKLPLDIVTAIRNHPIPTISALAAKIPTL